VVEGPRILRDTIHVTDEFRQTAFCLLGPTAVGKSRLAVELAERVGGEIIGADAFQVYAGLDILGAKPSPELRARVPHHLIGEVPLTVSFDVGQWLARARACVAEIAGRGRLPILCGGNGLYVRAFALGLASLPPADAGLRAALEKEPLSSLVERLRALDPATTVDMQNPRRVIRALEVCLLTGKPFSSFRSEWSSAADPRGIIVSLPHQRHSIAISDRTRAMFDAGVVEEVAAVREIGHTAEQMIGFREIRELCQGNLARGECVELIAQATRQYARRQMTWFRRERGLGWMDLSATADPVGDIERMAAILPVRDRSK